MAAGQNTSSRECCGCLFSIGFSFLISYIAFLIVIQTPRFYISSFQTPLLTSPLPANPIISYDLVAKNRSPFVGIYYDRVSLRVAYGPSAKSSLPSEIKPFYQGHGRGAVWPGEVDGSWVPWGEVVKAAGNGSRVVFTVGVDWEVRFKAVLIWKKRKTGAVAADVEVGKEGKMTAAGNVRLTNDASTSLSGRLWLGAIAAVLVFLLV